MTGSAQVTLHRNVGGAAVMIPVDFGAGIEYVKVWMQIVSAPKSYKDTAEHRTRLEEAFKAALHDPVDVTITGKSAKKHRQLLHVALATIVEWKMKGKP